MLGETDSKDIFFFFFAEPRNPPTQQNTARRKYTFRGLNRHPQFHTSDIKIIQCSLP